MQGPQARRGVQGCGGRRRRAQSSAGVRRAAQEGARLPEADSGGRGRAGCHARLPPHPSASADAAAPTVPAPGSCARDGSRCGRPPPRRPRPGSPASTAGRARSPASPSPPAQPAGARGGGRRRGRAGAHGGLPAPPRARGLRREVEGPLRKRPRRAEGTQTRGPLGLCPGVLLGRGSEARRRLGARLASGRSARWLPGLCSPRTLLGPRRRTGICIRAWLVLTPTPHLLCLCCPASAFLQSCCPLKAVGRITPQGLEPIRRRFCKSMGRWNLFPPFTTLSQHTWPSEIKFYPHFATGAGYCPPTFPSIQKGN